MIILRHGLSLMIVLATAACGFQLRESTELPPQMAFTQFDIENEYGTLARRVKVLLEQSDVTFVRGEKATAILEVPTNKVVTEVLTVGDSARVREYRISHTVRFRLIDSEGVEIVPWQTLRQAREISFDEQEILAASREQEYLKQDLADTLSRLLVMRLGTASPVQ